MEIVQIRNQVPVVSHALIAEHSNIKARSVRLLIDNHKFDLEEFGVVSFEMTPVSEEKLKISPDSKPTKTYYLNEQQATLLMTYLSNTPKVVEFKKALVKAFYQLKEKSATDPMHLIAQTLETLVSQQSMMMKLLERKATEYEAFPHVDKPTSRLALRRLSNEEKFIAKTRKVLKECDGLPQGDLLTALGRYKNDKTALRWLHGYDGIYWRANIIGGFRPTYSYSIIEEA